LISFQLISFEVISSQVIRAAPMVDAMIVAKAT